MMQQTIESSHTDSIQVQSWALGLKQVNPGNGRIQYFFTVCFWNRASVSVGQSRLHLQKQLKTILKTIRETSSLKGYDIFIVTEAHYLYSNTFASQPRKENVRPACW